MHTKNKFHFLSTPFLHFSFHVYFIHFIANFSESCLITQVLSFLYLPPCTFSFPHPLFYLTFLSFLIAASFHFLRLVLFYANILTSVMHNISDQEVDINNAANIANQGQCVDRYLQIFQLLLIYH